MGAGREAGREDLRRIERRMERSEDSLLIREREHSALSADFRVSSALRESKDEELSSALARIEEALALDRIAAKESRGESRECLAEISASISDFGSRIATLEARALPLPTCGVGREMEPHSVTSGDLEAQARQAAPMSRQEMAKYGAAGTAGGGAILLGILEVIRLVGG